jgi:hypothetical protein
VFSVQDVGGIEKFLGTIDNEADLVLLVHARGYDVACGTEYGTIRKTDEGFHIGGSRRTADCPIEMTRYLFHVRPSGETTVLGQEVLKSAGICIGRRLSGASPRAGHAASELGGLFAMASELEAESVESFFTLAKTLRRFAAPESLVRAAEAAARDERRHARSLGRLAARFGATPRAPRSGGREARSLFELARDNGVEGCVRETFGALVATRQAMAARDPYVAEAMRSIARDETRHAALAFAVAAWVKPALTELEQTDLERATGAALLALKAECAEDPSAALREAAGLPSANTALAMLGALEREVWSA